MIEYLKYTVAYMIVAYAVVVFYEMVEVPRRLEKARLRFFVECSEQTGLDCKAIEPVVFRCGEKP